VALIGAIVLSFFLPWPLNLVVVLGGAIVEVGEVTWGLRLARRWRPKSGPETMVGKTAEVVVPCEPNGQVRFHGELWEASCAAGAQRGETVRITSRNELSLEVEPVPPGESTDHSGPIQRV
jgi:membrane protein implicated in regulation of membrane protease activity